jgi:hypothetical protein
MAEIRVLNLSQTQGISPENGENISKGLQKLMLQIKGEFMLEEGRAVDYNGIKTSALFSKYFEQCSRLTNVDLRTLTDLEKMAFFISIFPTHLKS